MSFLARLLYPLYSRYQKGLRGERMAEHHLRDQGMRVIARRYRAAGGEIDLIARDADTLVFVEVKYRPSGARGDGLRAITPAKRARILRAAAQYLRGLGGVKPPVRFDVVEISGKDILHIQRAFTAQPGTRRTV